MTSARALFFLRQGRSVKLELAISGRLAGPQILGSSLSPPMQATPRSYMGDGDLNSGPHAQQALFLWSPLPSPVLSSYKTSAGAAVGTEKASVVTENKGHCPLGSSGEAGLNPLSNISRPAKGN